MSNIIFIGGIHGVGKGTLSKKICESYKFEHLSASEVLKWEDFSHKKNKKVKNIESTQDRLIHGLTQIIKPDKNYLLDGHFYLLNSQGIPEKVPEITFCKINPRAIIVLTNNIKSILNRLEKRDNKKYNIDILREMQVLEIEYAQEISSKLNIPFFHLKSQIDKSLQKFLTNYEGTN